MSAAPGVGAGSIGRSSGGGSLNVRPAVRSEAAQSSGQRSMGEPYTPRRRFSTRGRHAGVTLFFAGMTYAVVKTSVVESWPRVTSRRITADLRAVAQGTFNFSKLEHLMTVPGQDAGEDE
jgi:hypothetical protein